MDVKHAFSDEERRAIQRYVDGYGARKGKRAKHLPPGLAKKVARADKLWPGWQKECVVGARLPAKVYEQCEPLPPDLVVKLPPTSEPIITVAVGGKVVRLLKATHVILDVFDIHVNL